MKNLDALSIKQRKLLQIFLKNNKIINSKKLSFEIKMSIRTIKNYIKDINMVLINYDAKIVSIYSKGYKLEYYNFDKYNILKNENYFIDENYLNDYFKRITFILSEILLQDNYVKIDFILNTLHISIHTYSKDINFIREKLKNYNLKIITKNQKINIIGVEKDLRIFLNDFLLETNNEFLINKYINDKELNNNILLIKTILEKYNLKMSSFSIKNMARVILIGIKRFKNNKLIQIKFNQVSKNSIYYELSKELVYKLNNLYKIILTDNEVFYYALYLKSELMNYKFLTFYEKKYLHNCIIESFNEILNNFNIDFKNDILLYNNLCEYIPMMIIKIKNNMIYKNTFISDNLNKYLFAIKISHSFKFIFEKYYNININMYEFANIIMYFEEALLRNNEKNKKNIAFYAFNSIDELIYLREIKYKLKHYDFNIDSIYNLKNIDFIISTSSDVTKFNKDYFLINDINYLDKLEKILKNKYANYFELEKYFKQEYFIKNVNVSKKEAVIRYIIDFLNKNNLLKKEIFKLDFVSAELGKEVVHLQDLYKIIDKNICLILILKKSIFWETNSARIIILTKTKKDEDKDLYKICSSLSNFISKNDNIIRLIENKDFNSFINDLKISFDELE